MSTINGINTASETKTSRGTKIVQSNGQMDKNAFLRILTAELSNQDPENAKDSSAYVAQMAQFASIEQMTNLNTNLTMSAANSMIGKGVVLNASDSMGNQLVGIMKAAYKQGSTIKVGIDIQKSDGTMETQIYNYDDIQGVTYNPDETTLSNKALSDLLAEASLIGKRAVFTSTDASGKNYAGIIDGIVKNNGSFDLHVILDGSSETKDFALSDVKSINTAR